MSLAYAWQVVAGFSSRLAGHGGDGYQNLWNLWWVGRSLVALEDPFFTPLLHHPTGAPLWLHTLSPLQGALALPIDALLGQPAAYNTLFLLWFAASGLTLFLLLRQLGAAWLPAFLGGAVFTFSHYHFAHAQGHLNLVAMQWVPLFVLALVRCWRHRRLRDGLLLGAALSLATWTDLYYALHCALLGLLAAAWALATRRREALRADLARCLAAGAGLFLLAGGWLVAGVLWSWATAGYVQAHDPFFWSADLQGFFVPGWISAWSGLGAGLSRAWTGNPAENCWYLGWSVLGLGALAFALRPRGRRPWAWAGLALLGCLLALGPALHWGGRVIDLPMPFEALELLVPLVRLSGAPGRWHFLALLATAVLAGLGAAALRDRLAGRRLLGLPAGELAVGLALGLALLELLPRPVAATPLAPPVFLELVRAAPAGEALVDLTDCNRALYHQSLHEHPLVGGCLARNTLAAERFVREHPLLRALRGERALPPAEARRLAAGLGLRFVVAPRGPQPHARLSALGLTPRAEDGPLALWEVPWP